MSARPMKRSQALLALSREHHAVLGLARRAVAASRHASLMREPLVALPDLFARELFPLAEAILPAETLAAVAACVAAKPAPHISSTTTGVQTMATAPHLHLSPDALYPFDARGIAKRFRHAAIFGALDALNPGETMRFVNDHDPLPLLEQLSARYGQTVTIRYVQREPGAIAIDFIRN